MDPEFSNITNLLKEVEDGNMRNINKLCGLVKNNDKWLKSLDNQTAFRTALVFCKVIDSKVVNLKIRLEFATIICENLNKSTTIRPLITFQTSIQTVIELILEIVINCEDTIKYVKTTINLLYLFKIAILNNLIIYNCATERLFQRLMALILTHPVIDELKIVCMLVNIAVAKQSSKENSILSLFFNEINSEFDNVITFKVNVDNQNIHFVSFFVLSLIQNLMVENLAAAHTVTHSIFNYIIMKCKESESFNRYSVLFDKIFSDILTMSNSLLWPVTGLIIPKICRYYFCNVVDTGGDSKFTVFIVTQYTKLALKTTHNYQQYMETEKKLKKLIPNDNRIGGLTEIIFCIISNMRINEANGDVVNAYKSFWAEYISEESNCVHFPDKTENDALAAKYLLEYRNDIFHKTIANIAAFAEHKGKNLKNTVVKGLCDLIFTYPGFLRSDLVRDILLDNFEITSANVRDKMAQALARYVENYPEKLPQTENLIVRLLKDPSMLVCRAMLKGVTSMFMKTPIVKSSVIPMEVIQLFASTEDGTKKLVYNFFTSVWMESKYLSYLIKICVTTDCEIISNLFEYAKGNDLTKTKKKLVVVTKNLVNYFKNNETRLATAKLFLIITKMFPQSIVPHIPILTELLFDNSITDIKLKHIICKTLTILGSDVKNSELNIKKQIKTILAEPTNLPSYYYIDLIKLMLAVSDNSKHFKDKLFNKHLKILENVYMKIELYYVEQIKSAICFVLTLRLDYGSDERVLKIIHHFLETPSFTSTVLSALSEVRKMYIPVNQEPQLVNILIKFLNDSTNLQCVHNTLYYLQCLIRGSNKIRHVSNINNVGDPTNEYVSFYIQSCLEYVKKYCLTSNVFLRKAASKVLISILQSGLILFPRLLPTLVASSTDIDEEISKASLDQLDIAKLNNFDPSSSCIESLKLCYDLAQNVNKTSLTRGFNCETYESTCASWLKIVFKSKNQIRTLVNKVVTEIQNTTDLNFALYLLDVLVYIPPTSFEIIQFLFNLLIKTISNLPIQGNEKKICFLTKGEEFLDDLYKIRSKKGESPNPKNIVQRKGELKDYLPYLDSRMSQLKLEEEEDDNDMNCSLADLQRSLVIPCSVALVRIDANNTDNSNPKKTPLKVVIKRRVSENSEKNNWEIQNKKGKFESSIVSPESEQKLNERTPFYDHTLNDDFKIENITPPSSPSK